MRKTTYLFVVILSIAALLLSGCNFPTADQEQGSVQTAAALTVQAQLTSVAPATNTPVPFPTIPPANTQPPATTQPPANTVPAASPTSSCDNAGFIADVTIPDNTDVDPGDDFTKTWRLKNTGNCSWTPSYAVVFVNGASMNGPAVQALAGNVNPGQTVDISVNLTAPATAGTYTGNWALRNAAGVIFSRFYVQIVVGGGPFAVTRVTLDGATYTQGTTEVNCPIVTAHITTNGAGDVTYHWTRSDSATVAAETIHFSAAGSKDVQYKWVLGSAATGTNWVGIYIDDPNHQDFGHKNVNPCTTP